MLSREARFAARFLIPLVAGGLFFLTGCPVETPQAKKPATATAHAGDDEHDEHGGHEHHHHHAEKGPHDGALVAIGEDDAHVEVVLDADSGTLKAYVLDGEAEKAVAIKQASLQLAVTLRKGDEGKEQAGIPEDAVIVTLSAVSPADDGTASEFEGQSDELKGAEKFAANLTAVTVGGKSFKNVAFKYPEGNEEDHHH
ncbi:MAG: hypothetical protein ACM3U2_06055 [Deltaproteobacteria bacterium]